MAGGHPDERCGEGTGGRDVGPAWTRTLRGRAGSPGIGMTSSPIPDSRFPTPSREGQTFAGNSRWVTYVNFVKLPHTVFAMPFALVGVVLASYDAPVKLVDV